MRPLRRQPAALGSRPLAGRILLHTGTPASGPEVSVPPRAASPGFYASHWRSIDYFNLYRLTLSAVFAILSLLVTEDWLVGSDSPVFFRIAAFCYLAASALFVLGIRARWPSFPVQLSLHIFTDIVFITALANASGGVIEAPRGTLIHHYRVDENDQVARANLIVSTTHNNHAMNIAIREVARKYLDGQKLTEGLLNHIEVAVRAFDPCLSCATHALGQMPLAVELVDAEGRQVDRLMKSGTLPDSHGNREASPISEA